jgi:hypothetical protein
MNELKRVITDFDSEMIKNLGYLDKTRDKRSFLQSNRVFFSVAEYFGQSGWIILERVGNTETRQEV